MFYNPRILLTHFLAECKKKFPLLPITNLKISLNVDGVSPFKNSKSSFFVTLFQICNIPHKPVLPLCITFGKPMGGDLRFIEESIFHLNDLILNGINGITICIKNIVADAPARAFICGIKQFNAEHGCSKCRIKSIRYGKSRYFPYPPQLDLRQDHLARINQESNFNFHTPLVNLIGLDLINDVTVDVMHNVFLGVTKKLAEYLCKGIETEKNFVKLNANTIENINSKILNLRKFISNFYFARKPRPFDQSDKWKASEGRVFLIYFVCIVLQDMPEALYHHFLLLSTAITIMESKEFSANMLDYAHELIKRFIQQGEYLYGKTFLTFNVHSLLHLKGDVERHGPLSINSCFPFENFNSMFNKFIRARKYPLKEFSNRFLQKANESFFFSPDTKKKKKMAHFIVQGHCITVNSNDLVNPSETVSCSVYDNPRPIYKVPCDSRIIGRFVCSQSCNIKTVSKGILLKECIRFPVDRDNYAFIQLCHY